jgi:single-stranded-DNA-specific exonuclease
MSQTVQPDKTNNHCIKRWVYPDNKPVSAELVKAAGSNIIAKLLLNRNITTPQEAIAFLNPENLELTSPYLFDHMQKAVERINTAIKNQEKIIIWGDFDADGVTSTSLLYKALKHLDANVDFYIPDRTNEGHGLNSAAILKLISIQRTKLIITVDCGISNTTEIALAKGFNVDIIITDHHEPPEILPPAFAIINPKVPQENNKCSALKYLAGVGVAYKLAQAALEINNQESYTEHLLHLAAFGTIADVVPLIGENRTIVAKGLKLIQTKRPQPIMKLLESSGYKLDKGVSAEMIAFGIAPRINAVGRLKAATIAVQLLVSEDEAEIEQITQELNYNNQQRQKMCENLFLEAEMKISSDIDLENNRAIILDQTNWHAGIIGIVASKLTEKYNKPVFLISINEETKIARCSARSVKGLNLYETLVLLEDNFIQFGGHALAAGFSIDIEKIKLLEFKNKLNIIVNENFDNTFLEPTLDVEMEIQPEDVSIELIEELNKLAPFGEGNPSPVFSLSNLVLKQYKTMGANNNHLKLFLSDDNNTLFEAVWWQKNCLEASVLEKINIAFCPDVNNFGGKSNIQLIIKDLTTANPNQKAQQEFFIPEKPVKDDITPKWIDHRKKTELEKFLSSYLKTTKDNIIIYAENKNTLEFLEKDSLLTEKIFNRLNITKADQLVLFDLPPDLETLSELIKKSNAKIIHLIGQVFNEIEPVEIIKIFSGMLKFAYKNKGGEITINEIASKLFVSDMSIKMCINMLVRAKIINIIDKTSNSIKYEFIGSKDLSEITQIKEYQDFMETIKAVNQFRKQLLEDEIEKIQKFLDIYTLTAV